MKKREDMTKEEQQAEGFRIVGCMYLTGYSYTVIAMCMAFCYRSLSQCKIDFPTSFATVFSILFYSGGTLGYLQDFRVITWGGKGKPETIQKWVLIGSYMLGTFFAVIAAS